MVFASSVVTSEIFCTDLSTFFVDSSWWMTIASSCFAEAESSAADEVTCTPERCTCPKMLRNERIISRIAANNSPTSSPRLPPMLISARSNCANRRATLATCNNGVTTNPRMTNSKHATKATIINRIPILCDIIALFRRFRNAAFSVSTSAMLCCVASVILFVRNVSV